MTRFHPCPRNRLWRAASVVLLLLAKIGTAAPAITVQPTDTIVTAGQDATLSVVASGSGQLYYQWRHDGTAIAGATSAKLLLPHVSRGDAAWYDVTVMDDFNTITSARARLSVAPTQYPQALIPDAARDPHLEVGAPVVVNAAAALPGGGFIAGGNLSSVDGVPRSMVFELKADGTLDPNFVPAPIAGGQVETVAVQSDGKVLIGGRFSYVGPYLRNVIARLNADGSFDPSFDAGLVNSNEVRQIAVLASGKILVSLAGAGSGLIRLNADGSRDGSFASTVGMYVTAFAVQPDGRIVAGGYLAPTITVTGANNAIARFSADGTPDGSFVPLGTQSAPQAMVVAGDGSIYVAGLYGQLGSVPVTSLARITGSGAVDPSFTPVFGYDGTPATGAASALAVQPDGKVVAGGSFDYVNGLPSANLVRFAPTGARDLTFVAWPGVPSIQCVCITADGHVAVGAWHGSPADLRSGIARFNANGQLDAAVNPVLRAPAVVRGVTQLPGGQVLVYGLLDRARNQAVSGIVRLNADLTVDPTFNPGATSYATVERAIELSDRRIVVFGIATINGGSRLGVFVLDANGTLIAQIADGYGPLSNVTCTAAAPGGQFAIGGTGPAGAPGPGGGVALMSASGATVWAHYGFDAPVNAVYAQPDGKVIVGGSFQTYQGTAVKHLVRFNTDGTLDAAFTGSAATGAEVYAIASTPAGQLIVGGAPVYDSSGAVDLMRLNADGTRDTSFRGSGNLTVRSVLVQEDGRVIALCTNPYNVTIPAVVRYNVDGAPDSGFRAIGAVWGQVSTQANLVMEDDGRLLTAGAITLADALYVAKPAGPPAITTAPLSQVAAAGATVTFTAGATSDLPVTYQWLFNGQPIAGATGATYSVSSFSNAAIGTYAVRLTNLLGTTTSSAATLNPPLDTRARLLNLAIRSTTGAGADRLIVGYTVGGPATGATAMLVRGVGPTLATFGVPDVMADPMVELYGAGSVLLAANNDWAGGFDFTRVGAFPFAGAAPKDAAIYMTGVAPATYSAQLIAKGTPGGVGMLELYDATPDAAFTTMTPRLINGSARTAVGTGDNVLILGFVIGGSSNEKLLIRAAGPSLAAYGVAGALTDPQLEVYDAAHVKIAANDNWGDNGAAGSLASAFTSVNAFPFASATSKDAALTVTLPPGTYSALVRGATDTTGVALVELYEMP